jgi:hypothetical protein
MSLITKTNAQRIAEEIDASQNELLNHVQSMLKTIHAKVNTDGEQQAILDAFGANGVKALTAYSAMFQAVSAINPSTDIPAPDLMVFQPQQDGTVIFVAPPIPEPAPQP